MRRLAHGEPLHLLGGVLDPRKAPLPAQEQHGLEEAGAHRAARRGEAQGVDQVACALLPLGGEVADGLLYGLLGPLGEDLQAVGGELSIRLEELL